METTCSAFNSAVVDDPATVPQGRSDISPLATVELKASEKTPCACGCGQLTFPHDIRGRVKRFIWGHGPRTGKSKYTNATHKTCVRCGETKPMGEFYSSDTTVCKQCRLVYYKRRNANMSPDRKRELRAFEKLRYARLKAEILMEYGGKCACCGEAREEFLSIDHIHGGGTKHRKKVGAMGFFWLLRKLGYPKDDYRMLCMNCNFARGRFGYCPHEKEREV